MIDADQAKTLIPEYASGRMAGLVHQESSDLADAVLEIAGYADDNIVLPLVGRNAARLRRIVTALKDAEYTVYVHCMELDPEIAVQRVVARFRETGRFVDPAYVLSIGRTPSETYTRLKEEGAADGYSQWSNDVPKGERPRLIEVFGQGTFPSR